MQGKSILYYTIALQFFFGCEFLVNSTGYAQQLPYQGERIVLVADGNEHGKGDWAATPLSLALLASKELQDQVVIYAFNSHTWSSNKSHPGADAQMRESAFLGAKYFGFKKTKFIEAVNAPNYAIIELTIQVNKSSAKNPLLILAAGPLELIGTALNEADSTKLKYVRVISHSTWDQKHADHPEEGEVHSGWTWEKLQDSFQGNQLQLISLVNEMNGLESLKAPLADYTWLKDASIKEPKPFEKGSWGWLYSRLEASSTENEVNPDDVRLIYYLFTGNSNPSLEELQSMLTKPSKWDSKK